MSFRAKLLLSMLGLVAASSLATLIGLEVVVRREVVLRLEDDLRATRDALAQQLEGDLSRLEREAKVAAEEPRLKALLNTEGIDVDTLEDVADETRRAAGWDLLALSTADRSVATLTGTETKQPVAEAALFDRAVRPRAPASGGERLLDGRAGAVPRRREVGAVRGCADRRAGDRGSVGRRAGGAARFAGADHLRAVRRGQAGGRAVR